MKLFLSYLFLKKIFNGRLLIGKETEKCPNKITL